MLAQSHQHLEITLLDDGASDEYREYVESLGDPRVQYRRNAVRLGAMRNMFAAITAGTGRFTLAFHEDDLLGASYVQTAIDILERHPRCAFVACQLTEFEEEPTPAALAASPRDAGYAMFDSSGDLVRGILRGVEPMFGSVVYRRTALEGVEPDHEGYATLVDRPFLLSIMDRGCTAAVIDAPLVWYRRHGEGDTRHMAMTAEHVLHLLRRYRAALPVEWSADERTAFFKYTGYWLFELYRMTLPAQRPPVWRYLLRAWHEGLYDPRARGRFGLRQIQRALLNQTS